jgi:hypothetical protein
VRHLFIVAALVGCQSTNELKADAIILAQASDVPLIEAALDQYEDILTVKVAVTSDPKKLETWKSLERWRVKSAPEGFEIRGETLCEGTLAVTDYDNKTIWIGHCIEPDEDSRAYVAAHEVGHVLGASDCDDGVMHGENVPITIEPSEFTRSELVSLYPRKP